MLMMILEKAGKPCRSIDYSPDGQSLVAAYGHKLVLWDIAVQKEMATFPGDDYWLTGGGDSCYQVRFSPLDGKLVVGGWRALRFFSLPTLENALTLRSRRRTEFTKTFHFSRNGSLVAAKCGPIRVWDLTNEGEERQLLPSLYRRYAATIQALAFLPNDWLAVGIDRARYEYLPGGHFRCKQIGMVKIRDPRGSRDYDKVQGPEYPGSILAIACSPNGTLIASGVGKKIEIWNLQKRSAHATCRGHRRFIRHLAFTPDGEHLVSSTWDEVKVWHVASGRAVGTYKWEIGKLTSLAMAPDGMTAAVASEEGKIAIWDLDSGS